MFLFLTILCYIFYININSFAQHKICLHRSDDPHSFALSIAPIFRIDKANRHLEDEGYDVEYDVSKTFELCEGNIIGIDLRGNVGLVDGAKQQSLSCIVFNSQMTNNFKLSLQVKDKYLQKAYKSYRGFIRIVEGSKPRDDNNGEDDNEEHVDKKTGNETAEAKHYWEHMIHIPKEVSIII